MNKWQMNAAAGIVWPYGGGVSAPDGNNHRHLSIHPNGRKNAKKGSSTAPVRERPNLSMSKKDAGHNSFKGGKRLRKALYALQIRRNDAKQTQSELSRHPYNLPENAVTIPGSMKG